MDMLSRLERAFRGPLDARKGTSLREPAETDVGRSWQSWWNDGRWDRWIENVVPALCCGPRARGLLEIHLLLFLVRGLLAARDFGLPNFLGLFCVAMDSFTTEFRACFLHDSTSPKLVGLSVNIPGCGLLAGRMLKTVFCYTQSHPNSSPNNLIGNHPTHFVQILHESCLRNCANFVHDA